MPRAVSRRLLWICRQAPGTSCFTQWNGSRYIHVSSCIPICRVQSTNLKLIVYINLTILLTEEQGRRHDGQCVLDETTAGLNTVLHLAAGQGKIGLVRKLCDGDDTAAAAVAALLPKETTKSETALHHAARAGRRDMVSLLIRLAQMHGSGAPGQLVTKNSAGDCQPMELGSGRNDKIAYPNGAAKMLRNGTRKRPRTLASSPC